MRPFALSLALLFFNNARAAPADQGDHRDPTAAIPEPDPSLSTTVLLNGQSFVDKGLVAFGLIPSNFRESTGDTFGGAGSAIAIKRGSIKTTRNRTVTGTLVMQPDRGFNIITTVDYQARQFHVDFALQPYYGTANLSFADAQNTLSLKYRKTLLYTERNRKKTTGLDALGVRPAQFGAGISPLADPPMPIANKTFDHLTMDSEGLVLLSDGGFWTSDEYGPYIYHFDHNGDLIQTIAPPKAILPMQNGTLNFTASVDPTTGRISNQGFEGFTISPDEKTLYALLQSATEQDGGGSKSTSRFTRMFAYSLPSFPLSLVKEPKLIGEWVVPLPLNAKGNTLAQSDFHFLSDTVFLVLARDGNGNGGSPSLSSYKQADLFDISKATNIAGTKFDLPQNPVSPKGVLDPSITPAQYVPFVNYLNTTQLARLGLHNGNPVDHTLVDAKWESLALVPVDDPAFPDDYFLFTASDNDFLSTQGFFDGQPFNAGQDVDTQIMVFRLTLPAVARGSVERSLSL